MATRSAIARKNKDGSYTGIYCHWDGYPDGNGRVLFDNYNDDKKIDDLLTLGNISSLYHEVSPPVGVPHSYNNPAGNVTVAYHRDWGEDFNQYKGESLIDVLSKIDHEWAYVWIDGKWEVWGYDYQGESLEKVLEKQDS